MTDLSDRVAVALADRYRIEGEVPALKGGLGAARRVVNDAVVDHPSECGAVRRTAAEPGLQPRHHAAPFAGDR